MANFIFGEPVPILNEADLQLVRDLHQKLDSLSSVLEGAESRPGSPNGRSAPLSQPESGPSGSEQAYELTEQVRKLAKSQFKTNTLQESQLAQQQATLESLQKSLEQQEKLFQELAKQQEEALEAARLELLKSVLPVLDSLDAAFRSGRRQALRLPMPSETRQAVIAWLDGLRLARMRLLDLLAAHGIQPIPTIGQPFDPRCHIAVAVDTTGRSPDGTIVSEDRPGYASAARVLREAEVVVSRSK
jgi:molecular chaperone GrpE